MLDFMVPRYRQILVSVLLSVFIPTLIQYYITEGFFLSNVVWFSINSAVIAIWISFLLIYQFNEHPRIELPYHIIFAHTMIFGVLIAVIFVLRIPYSVTITLIAYFFSILFSLSIFPAIDRYGSIVFALVPGGDVQSLKNSGLISCRVISKPEGLLAVNEHLVADLDFKHAPEWDKFLADNALAGREVHGHKSVLEQVSGRMTIDRLSENTMGSLLPSQLYLSTKMVIDYAICFVVLLPVLLGICVAGLLIFIKEGRPIFFMQTRIGYKGKPFTAYKLRTMFARRKEDTGTENASAAAMTLENDPRITPLGSVLRKFRIDELPQILNILNGEMSWIGPRPEALALHHLYAEKLPFYRYRSVVRPGITGWAQVMQGHVTSVDDVHEKLKYDFYYIKHLSLSLDIIIILKTVKTVLLGSGAK